MNWRESHGVDRGLGRVTSCLVPKVSNDRTRSHHALIGMRNADSRRLHWTVVDSEMIIGRHWRDIDVVVHRGSGNILGRIDWRNSGTRCGAIPATTRLCTSNIRRAHDVTLSPRVCIKRNGRRKIIDLWGWRLKRSRGSHNWRSHRDG